jgi:hypothetical protein
LAEIVNNGRQLHHLARNRGHNPLHRPDDPATLRALSAAIRDGLSPVSAGQAIGIPRSTFYQWIGEHPGFADVVEDAVADLKHTLAKVVQTEATKSKNWVAAMTMLERLFPSEYGRRDRVRHEHTGMVGLAVTPARLSGQAMLKLADVEADLSVADDADRRALPTHEMEES